MIKIILKLFRITICTLFLAALGVFIVLCYATKIEPYRLTTETVTIQTAFSETLKIVQVSDIQISENFITENLNKVVRKINAQNPDVVLFTGDLYEVYAEYHDDGNLIDLLATIEAQYGKFAIWGNRDCGGGAAWQYEHIMEQSGFQLLRNEGVCIMLNSREQLFLAGLDDALLGTPDITPIMKEFQSDEYSFSILMTHEPDSADLYADMGFDLIVSGHSHGGQVNVPFLPKITTSMAEKYVDGLYELNEKTSLYVNSGIGTSRYPIRFGVVPEITVFSLEKEK